MGLPAILIGRKGYAAAAALGVQLVTGIALERHLYGVRQ